MGQTILVTGGAGYVGSHVVVALLEKRHKVVVLDDLSRGTRDALQRAQAVGAGDIELEVGDLCDPTFVDAVFSRHNPLVVVHLAAFKSVEESVRDPESYERVNVVGTEILADAMVRHGTSRVVYASTAAVYGGVGGSTPLDEDSAISLESPYATTKYMAEQILNDRAAAHGWGLIHLRFFNVCGAHPSGQLGEFVDRPQNLMPILFNAVLSGEPVRVFGTDWDTRDGTCIRDYIHVMDIVSGVEEAVAETRFPGSAAYNLGTGTGSTVLEVVAAVERATGRPLERVNSERRPGDPPVSLANADRASTALGWYPRFTLDDMAVHAWQWMQIR